MASGHTPHLWIRDPQKALALFGTHLPYYTGTLEGGENLSQALEGTHTLYHLAGTYRFGLRHQRSLYTTNYEGTRRILQAAKEANVQRVLHLSSAGLLARPHTLSQDNIFPAQKPTCGPYKASKWMAETLALQYAAEGLPVIIASPTCPLGPEDNTPTGKIIRDFLQGRFLLSCHTGLNFLDVEDLAQGLIACACYGTPGQRYILSHHNIMLTDFLHLLSRLTGLPAPRAEIPSSLLYLLGRIADPFTRWTHPDNITPLCRETATQSLCIQFFDNTDIQKALRWQPTTSLETTLKKTLDYYALLRDGSHHGRV